MSGRRDGGRPLNRWADEDLAIGEYGVVGDCRAAALVSRYGSVDWLCLPRFDSPAVFAALLDRDRGGRFAVAPTSPGEAHRRYLPGTNILETEFVTDSGRLLLTDAMPVASERLRRWTVSPERELLRRLECRAGAVEVEVRYDPRFDFGRRPARLEQHHSLGVWCSSRGRVLSLLSDVPLELDRDEPGAVARFTLREGERRHLSLAFTEREPAVFAPIGDAADARLERSRRWWVQWSDQCCYDGPYRDAVVRSALALKLLAYSPSGALCAAPTTSLPERAGGSKNWDYRFCWLRDSSYILSALLGLGYLDDGQAFFDWMVHATRRNHPRLLVVYDLYGRRCPDERELDFLRGWRGSRPVRVGNGAGSQRQLDLYGEVVAAAAEYVSHHGALEVSEKNLLLDLGRRVVDIWPRDDSGIWEARAEPRPYTHSKAGCLLALETLVELHRAGELEVPVNVFTETSRRIRKAIEENGWNEELGSYTSFFGSDVVDASLILLGLYRYVEPGSPRMRSTFDLIERRLDRGGLLMRYGEDYQTGLAGAGEGAFLLCGFWAVQLLARQGRLDEAARRFERHLEVANDLGLLSEEADPDDDSLLGNFPQAISHVGLINAALDIERCAGRREEEP